MLKERNIPVKDLAAYMNMENLVSAYCWFRGDHMPTIDNLVIMTEFFDCKLDDIVRTKEV
ncbi:MAG: helix-turn-helix transcriptional regulator [Prevotella sp.]|nr:helix-turn-helix transcriptional regulator [Candidatus Prevotella equi]